VRASGRTLARHHHELIPAGEHLERGEIGQLCDALAQSLEDGHALKRMRLAPSLIAGGAGGSGCLQAGATDGPARRRPPGG
jgi:hypothetical protein